MVTQELPWGHCAKREAVMRCPHEPRRSPAAPQRYPSLARDPAASSAARESGQAGAARGRVAQVLVVVAIAILAVLAANR